MKSFFRTRKPLQQLPAEKQQQPPFFSVGQHTEETPFFNTASPALEDQITQAKGDGQPLDPALQQSMQPYLNEDISDIQIHTNNNAANLSSELEAQAFTHGKDIFFNEGRFAPETPTGKHLLAHEVSHAAKNNTAQVMRKPETEKERAQKVRDNYKRAKDAGNWGDAAMYFNAFNQPEINEKLSKLSPQQKWLLHDGAVRQPGVGPWSAAALNTNPTPMLDSSTVATAETALLQNDFKLALDTIVNGLSAAGLIDLNLIDTKKMNALEDKNMKTKPTDPEGDEGRTFMPSMDPATNTVKPAIVTINTKIGGWGQGVPYIVMTVMHEYQHVLQFKSDPSMQTKGLDTSNTADEQREIEAYAKSILMSKQTGLYTQPASMEETWKRLHGHWIALTMSDKKHLRDLYVSAYKVATEVVGKFKLIYTPDK